MKTTRSYAEDQLLTEDCPSDPESWEDEHKAGKKWVCCSLFSGDGLSTFKKNRKYVFFCVLWEASLASRRFLETFHSLPPDGLNEA